MEDRAIKIALAVIVAALVWAFARTFLPAQEAAGEKRSAVQWLPAKDGSTLGQVTVAAGFAACRGSKDFWLMQGLREDRDEWASTLEEKVEMNRCIGTEDDLIVLGPAGIPGAVAMSFRNRADVHPSVAWYLSCEAIPTAAREAFCYYGD
jgi:hypothetical protein